MLDRFPVVQLSRLLCAEQIIAPVLFLSPCCRSWWTRVERTCHLPMEMRSTIETREKCLMSAGVTFKGSKWSTIAEHIYIDWRRLASQSLCDGNYSLITSHLASSLRRRLRLRCKFIMFLNQTKCDCAIAIIDIYNSLQEYVFRAPIYRNPRFACLRDAGWAQRQKTADRHYVRRTKCNDLTRRPPASCGSWWSGGQQHSGLERRRWWWITASS